MVGIQPTLTALTFYRSDGVTPLGDPGSFDETPVDNDLAEDVIAGSPSDLQSLLRSSDSSDGEGARDDLDAGIFEVYGPPTKQQRSSILITHRLHPLISLPMYISNGTYIQRRYRLHP